MPFKSEAQKKWLQANKPEVAKQFEQETPSNQKLPQRVGKPSDSEKRRRARLLAKKRSQKKLSNGLTNQFRNQQISHNKKGNRIGDPLAKKNPLL